MSNPHICKDGTLRPEPAITLGISRNFLRLLRENGFIDDNGYPLGRNTVRLCEITDKEIG